MIQVQTSNLLVYLFRQRINLTFFKFAVFVFPKRELSQNLVRERSRHDKTWVTGCATQIYQTASGQERQAFMIWKNKLVYLGFNIFTGNFFVILKPGDV